MSLGLPWLFDRSRSLVSRDIGARSSGFAHGVPWRWYFERWVRDITLYSTAMGHPCKYGLSPCHRCLKPLYFKIGRGRLEQGKVRLVVWAGTFFESLYTTSSKSGFDLRDVFSACSSSGSVFLSSSSYRFGMQLLLSGTVSPKMR